MYLGRGNAQNVSLFKGRFFIFFSNHPEILIILCSLSSSIIVACLMLYNDPNSLLYYDDALSHLVISKRVVDSLTPGLAQFGTAWLPMAHVMLIPFVLNNFLFQTGLAGTIVSGVSMAIAAAFLFKIVKLHFASNMAGFLASSLFLLNTSVLYMSVVPMLEAPFMMFFMAASYYALNWYFLHSIGNNTWLQYRNLLKCALAVSAASLTHYEAWYFPLGLIFMISIVLLYGKKELWKRKIEAFLLISGIYSVIGMGIWIIYNGIIFRNPFYFLTGPYASQAQEATNAYRQHLFLQPFNAVTTVFGVASDMYGPHVVLLSIIGMGLFIYMKRKRQLLFSLLTFAILVFPTFINFLAMIQGSGEIYKNDSVGWLNGRYLIFIAPLFAFSATATVVFAANLAKKILTPVLVFVVVSFYVFSIFLYPLQIGQSTVLSDSYNLIPYHPDVHYAIDAANALKKFYTGDRVADFTLSRSSPIIQLYSGVPLKDFIDINNKDYWEDSEAGPWTHVRFIILQKPIDNSTGIYINQSDYFDPPTQNILFWNKNLNSLLSSWQPSANSLLSSVSIVYQNPNFMILKNEQKDIVLERVLDGFPSSSDIAILDKDNLLVAEKNGQIFKVVNGKIISSPLFELPVDTRGERGLYGIATTKNETSHSNYVFLYFTEKNQSATDNIEPLGNRLYRYELSDSRLINPKLLIDLPAGSPYIPNAGKVIIGPDKNVYLLVNEAKYIGGSDSERGIQNDVIVKPENGRVKIITKPSSAVAQETNETQKEHAKILGITQDGKPIRVQGSDESTPINGTDTKTFVTGIGDATDIDFDTETRRIWYTGNEYKEDKTNYNGTSESSNLKLPYIDSLNMTTKTSQNESYDSARVEWNYTAGPFAIKFLDTDKLGSEYKNDLLVGDAHNGNLYRFDLPKDRTSLELNGSLAETMVKSQKQFESQVFLRGLGGITNMKVGPDGYLYITVAKSQPEHEGAQGPYESIFRLRASENK